MSTSMARLGKRGLIALLAATSFVMGPVGPAAAQVHGEIIAENVGVGYEWAHPVTSNCLGDLPLVGNTAGSEFHVTDEGTYDGVTSDPSATPIASFVGTTNVFIRTEPYVISPEGTYSDCTLLDPVVQINAANVSTPVGQDGQVTCEALDGTYTRRAFDVIEITLTGQCDVIGNVPGLEGHVVDQSTTHVITGLQQPCTVPNPVTGDSVPEECLLFPEAGSYVTWDHVVLPAEAEE